MKYYVGDRVQIKDTDIEGTIESIIRGQVIVDTKGSKIPVWPECIVLMKSVEEETNDCEKCGLIHNSTRCLFMDNCPHNKQTNIIEIPEDYVIKDENGNIINATKIVLEKKKKEYPKTYRECCDELYRNSRHDECYEACLQGHPMQTFARLLICRDAYWKLYGEEMGLGKPWEPDWTTSEPKYVIACTSNGIQKQWEATYCKVFAFPTEEMRDAFKENFDPDIEICKELL